MDEPTPNELWTIEQVTEYLGAASTGSARRTLSRWGVTAATYRPTRPGGRPQAHYPAREILQAQAVRPGRGARTDRRGT